MKCEYCGSGMDYKDINCQKCGAPPPDFMPSDRPAVVNYLPPPPTVRVETAVCSTGFFDYPTWGGRK